MLGRASGAVLLGVDARLVEVEVDLSGGLPAIAALGLPDPAVREGLDRIRSALRHAGHPFPQQRVVINLAPAELRKQGAGLDLPIAAALLVAAERLRLDLRAVVLAGELGLDGSVRPVRGALSMALAARQAGRRTIVLPRENAAEAALVAGLDVVAVGSLADLFAAGAGTRSAPPPRDALAALRGAQQVSAAADLRQVRGQAAARRALEIAAAGGHHLLLHGPPGSGKTMLARRLPGILPPLALDEALAVTRVHSAAGLTRELVAHPPFRAPHHGISAAGMTGGGPALRPGEVSLATHGVLYLDELTEFRRDALEALRQPLEDGYITVVRVHGAVTFPAEFALVASMNPCPCGYLGNPDGRCCCTPSVVERYLRRLSGPLLDRFDLVVDVPAVELASLAVTAEGEASRSVRERVLAARACQHRRFAGSRQRSNARMGSEENERFARPTAAATQLLLAAAQRLGLSARGFERVRRVARTIADLEASPSVEPSHIAEALQYRRPPGAGWAR